MQKNNQTIGKEELSKLLHDENYVVIDVLSKDSYESEHIENSISIPLADLEKGEVVFQKDKKIVTYCASYSCSASSRAAEFLRNKGYDARAYEGGIDEWKKSGMPLEGKNASK